MKTDELDLGIMPKKETEICSPCKPCCPDTDTPRYPDMCFRGEHADLFRKKYGPCAPGDEYEVTVRLKVKSSSDGENEYDKRIEFNVTAIIGDVVEEESSEGESDGKKAPRKMVKAKSAEKSEGAY